MKYIISLLLLLVQIAFCCSCGKSNRTTWPDDAYLSHLLSNQTDSLAMLLEEEIDPTTLPDSNKAEYGWWIAQLHQRQGRSLMNDSIIQFTLRYYEANESPRLPFTYVLAGAQLNWSGQRQEEEFRMCRKGVEIAESWKDTSQVVKATRTLGHLYSLASNFTQSIEYIEKYVAYSRPGSWDRMMGYYLLGCSYGQLGPADSMEYYMKEAIALSRELKNEKEYYITRNYVDCLNGIGQSEKALLLLRELRAKFSGIEPYDYNIAAMSFAYANAWMNLGRMDSARVYLDQTNLLSRQFQLQPNESEYQIPLVFLAKMLDAVYDVKKGNPIKLINLYMFTESVADVNKKQAAIDWEREFSQNKLERSNLLLKIKEKQRQQQVILILLLAGGVIAVLVYLYQRKLLKKERSLQQVKEQIRHLRMALSENEQQIRQNEEAEVEEIQQENERLQQEKQKLTDEINRLTQAVPEKSIEIDAYERMLEQNTTFVACAKQLSAILIGQHDVLKQLQKEEVQHLSDIDWVEVYRLIDQVFNRYTKRLRTTYPLLTEEDIQCCCLIKLQLSTSAIARLYSLAPSSVTKRKQRIKERINQLKAGLISKEQPVDVYLWGY